MERNNVIQCNVIRWGRTKRKYNDNVSLETEKRRNKERRFVVEQGNRELKSEWRETERQRVERKRQENRREKVGDRLLQCHSWEDIGFEETLAESEIENTLF